LLQQAVNEMQDDLVRLRQETAKYMGSLKQLEVRYDEYRYLPSYTGTL
jgi:phage shock protein A